MKRSYQVMGMGGEGEGVWKGESEDLGLWKEHETGGVGKETVQTLLHRPHCRASWLVRPSNRQSPTSDHSSDN